MTARGNPRAVNYKNGRKLNEQKEQLKIDPALAPDAETTIHVLLYNDPLWYELPRIDFIADRSPGVEVAVAARISDSITDEESRYSKFYPLIREFYEDEENDESLYYREDYDATRYVDCAGDYIKVEAALTGFEGKKYKLDLADEKFRPAGWEFYRVDPDIVKWMGKKALEAELEPFQAVLVKCNPKTGAVTRVEGDTAKFGPEHDGALAKLLPEVSVRTEEKDGKRFYLDAQGNEYFFLRDLPRKAIRFGRTKSGWFHEYPDRSAWLRKLKESL